MKHITYIVIILAAFVGCIQTTKEISYHFTDIDTIQQDDINVTLFGAIPDDDTLDRVQLQECFDSAALYGMPVYLPKGTYLIDSLLFVSHVDGFKVYGEGTIKYIDGIERGDGNGARSIMMFDNVDHLTIEGLTLDANAENRPTDGSDKPAHNLRLRGCDHLIIRDIHLPSSVSDGITLQKYSEDIPENILIDNVTASQFWRSGISIINGININITNSMFGDPQPGALGGGINLEPNINEVATVRTVKISNCVFEDSLRYGIQVAEKFVNDVTDIWVTESTFRSLPMAIKASGSVTISECNFKDIYSAGATDNAIDIRGTVNFSYPDVTIKDCDFKDISSRVIYANGVTRSVTFRNNKVKTSGKAMSVPTLNLYADSADIFGNQFFDGYWGLALYDVAKLDIAYNYFDGHAKYSVYLNGCLSSKMTGNSIEHSNQVSFSSKGNLLITNLLGSETIVKDNIFMGTGTAIEVDDNQGLQIFHANIFHGYTNTIRYDAGANATSYVLGNVVNGVL